MSKGLEMLKGLEACMKRFKQYEFKSQPSTQKQITIESIMFNEHVYLQNSVLSRRDWV